MVNNFRFRNEKRQKCNTTATPRDKVQKNADTVKKIKSSVAKNVISYAYIISLARPHSNNII